MINFFASIIFIGLNVYWLKVFIITYSIFKPTVKAVLDGRVQGVVVQARKKKSPISLNLEGRKRETPLDDGHNYFETKKDKMKQGVEYV